MESIGTKFGLEKCQTYTKNDTDVVQQQYQTNTKSGAELVLGKYQTNEMWS